MMKFKKLMTASLFLVYSSVCSLFSQTPPNPTANMNTTMGAFTAYNSGLSIAANFTAGRRFEEANIFGASNNMLGDMTLPSDYNSLTLAEKTLFIINAERACRNGINYGSGALTVKPVHGIETHLSSVSQAHADWLMANNLFQHCGDPSLGTGSMGCPTNSSPSQRINSNTTLVGGWESSGENIGYGVSSGASTFPTLNEQTIFDMLYQDAGSSWGHRVNFLKAFNDDYGASGNEGFIGVAEKLSTVGVGYQTWAYGKVIVYNIYDPFGSASNAFTFSAVLPVELLAFDVKAQQKGIELTWATVSEIGFEGFDIERSEDGVNFKTMDFVGAQAKSKSSKTDYTFLDPSVKPHLVYFYRLRMIDDDGKFKHSPTRSAILRGQKTGVSDYRLSANLTNATLSVENLAYESRDWTIQLFDISGKLLLAQKTNLGGGEKQNLALPTNLNSGLYLIRIADAQFSKTEKIVLAN